MHVVNAKKQNLFYLITIIISSAAQKSINSTCTATNQCITSAGLSCLQGICSCASNLYFWDGSSCRKSFEKISELKIIS
jgi:hypothetical protein